MKKRKVALFISAILIICAVYSLVYSYKILSNKIEAKHTLEKAYNLITSVEEEDESIVNADEKVVSSENKPVEITSENGIILEDGIIGILVIPQIGVNAPIREGTSQEVMKTSVGHFIESDYWNGNVSLASHNGGTNAHYFQKLNNLKENDEIEYITKLGRRKYRIYKISKISSCDWTSIVSNKNNTCENTITLITCINGAPNCRLCVRGTEI